MTEEQMEELKEIGEIYRYVRIDMLNDQSDRTLLWGYTCNRADWHVYIKHGQIHLHSSGGVAEWQRQDGKTNIDLCKDEYLWRELIPDKRLYPEACDYEFCKLLKELGAHMPFTTYNNRREPKKYHGPVI